MQENDIVSSVAPKKDYYTRKLLYRVEGIWHNNGLILEEKRVAKEGAKWKLTFRFANITPHLAESIVDQLGIALRKAHVYWKQFDNRIIVCIEY